MSDVPMHPEAQGPVSGPPTAAPPPAFPPPPPPPPGPPNRPDRPEATRLLVPALILVVMVAAAAAGSGLLVPSADLDDTGQTVVRVVGLAVAAVGLLLLVGPWRSAAWTGADALPAVLAIAAAVIVVLALLSIPTSPVSFTAGDGRDNMLDQVGDETVDSIDFPQNDSSTSTTVTTTEPDDREEVGHDEGPDLMRLWRSLVVGGLVVAALLALLWSWSLGPWRRSSPPLPGTPLPPEDQPPVDADAAEAGLTASLATVAAGDDPRAAIVNAYLQLLEALAEAGGARRQEEAPHEHLNRVLGPLGVRPEPIHQLAELFVMARFSPHPVTEQHRDEAAALLNGALADIRTRMAMMAVPTQEPSHGG